MSYTQSSSLLAFAWLPWYPETCMWLDNNQPAGWDVVNLSLSLLRASLCCPTAQLAHMGPATLPPPPAWLQGGLDSAQSFQRRLPLAGLSSLGFAQGGRRVASEPDLLPSGQITGTSDVWSLWCARPSASAAQGGCVGGF